jgi:hypothetical protein
MPAAGPDAIIIAGLPSRVEDFTWPLQRAASTVQCTTADG